MMKIITMICILFLLVTMLSSSGCCFLAGAGMESKNKKRQTRNNRWHEKMVRTIDRI